LPAGEAWRPRYLLGVVEAARRLRPRERDSDACSALGADWARTEFLRLQVPVAVVNRIMGHDGATGAPFYENAETAVSGFDFSALSQGRVNVSEKVLGT
jgi:hypothetical protein